MKAMSPQQRVALLAAAGERLDRARARIAELLAADPSLWHGALLDVAEDCAVVKGAAELLALVAKEEG